MKISNKVLILIVTLLLIMYYFIRTKDNYNSGSIQVIICGPVTFGPDSKDYSMNEPYTDIAGQGVWVYDDKATGYGNLYTDENCTKKYQASYKLSRVYSSRYASATDGYYGTLDDAKKMTLWAKKGSTFSFRTLPERNYLRDWNYVTFSAGTYPSDTECVIVAVFNRLSGVKMKPESRYKFLNYRDPVNFSTSFSGARGTK
jgi:hypothetical protein